MATIEVAVMMEIDEREPVELRGDDRVVAQIGEIPIMEVMKVVAQQLSNLPISGFRGVSSIAATEVKM